MSDVLPPVPVLLVALSVGCLLWVTVSIWMARADVGKEDWRDRPPLFFRLLSPFVGVIIHRVEASQKPFQLEVVQDKLDAAGMGYALRPAEFIATRRVGLALGVVVFVFAYFVLKPTSMSMILLVGAFIPFGFFYPDMWLRDVIKRRHARIEKQFPFFLDLLVLTMRAGLNFSSAMAHSVEKMTEGPVKQEFAQFLREVRTGARRRDALESLGRRINLSAVHNFVSAVNQAEEIGGELGPILVSQARQRRAERFLKAEKLANQAPVKMMLPLIGVLFPMMFLIIGFPIFIKGRESGALGISVASPSPDYVLSRAGGAEIPLAVVGVANTWWRRAVGLLGQRGLGPREGLFLAPCSGIHTVGMRFAIDVVFVDRQWRVVRARAGVAPWRFVMAPGAYGVVELAAGSIARLSLAVGDALALSPVSEFETQETLA